MVKNVVSFEVGEIFADSDHCEIKLTLKFDDREETKGNKEDEDAFIFKSNSFPNWKGFDFSELDSKDLCLLFKSDYVVKELGSISNAEIINKYQLDLSVKRFENLMIHISSTVWGKGKLIKKGK